MTLEGTVMTMAMIVVLASGMDMVISSDMPENTSLIVSSMDLFKVSAIIIGGKLLTK